jgi:hypothetical protein
MMFARLAATILTLSCSAAVAQVVSDVTEDGLVRVPSSHKAGVYRLPDAKFAQYRRIILLPASVTIGKELLPKSFTRVDTGLKPSERQAIMNDLKLGFHLELVAELVERAGFALATTRAPDVLLVVPMIEDVDLTSVGTMTLIVELRDAASNVTVARIVDYEKRREPPLMSGIAEARIGFANAARYSRSAINIARTERDETAAAPQ